VPPVQSGENPAEKHPAINDERQEEAAELRLPTPSCPPHCEGQKAADDDSARKPDVKMIQLRRLVRRIKRRDERIARGLNRPVRNAKQEGARIKAPVVPGKDRQQNPGEMPDKGQADDPAKTEDIAQWPPNIIASVNP